MTYPQNSPFIKLDTLEYPLYEGDIRRAHPEITDDQTWPNFPIPEGYAVVRWIDPPKINPDLQMDTHEKPIFVDGEWRMQWSVRDLTPEEIEDRERRKAEMRARTDMPEISSASTTQATAITPEMIAVADTNVESVVTVINP